MSNSGSGFLSRLFRGKQQTDTAEEQSLRGEMDKTPILALSFNYDRPTEAKDISQVEVGLDRILNCMSKLKLTATFHCAAKLCDTAATQIAHIRDAGHEIACNGYSRENLTEQSPESLRNLLLRCRDFMARRGIQAHGFHPPSEGMNPRIYKELAIHGFRYVTELKPSHTPVLLHPAPHPLVRMPITSNDSGYLRHRAEPHYVYEKHHELIVKMAQGKNYVGLNYHLSLLGESRQRIEDLLLIIEGAMKMQVAIRPFAESLPKAYRPPPPKKVEHDPWGSF